MLLVKCPVPGCDFIANIILKKHYDTHGMTRKEAVKQYGVEKYLMPNFKNRE